MPITPPESKPSPRGEPVAAADAGEPKEPVPEVKAAPAPVPAAEKAEDHNPPTSPDAVKWSLRIGEVFDFGDGGRFTVKERLGRGGAGEVYRAEHVAPDAKKLVQDVALKVLRPDALPRHERTFIDEVHLLSLLCHNNIARYHTFFLDKGRQVLVMEYVHGLSLDCILELARRKGRTLSESTSFELLAQVAEALSYAYAAKDEHGRPLNIVHRDVSPGNIIVNSAGFAMLVDFGVAKCDLENRTQTRPDGLNIRGKLPYLTPEQVLNQPHDGSSDLFSLCCVLVEMLTGEPPFGRELKALESIMTVTPAYVDHVTRGLSKKVRAICHKALARDPRDRFADGHEMAAAMLANHSYRGPFGVQEEIAALVALPDAPAKTEERAVTDLRRVKRKLRALVPAGALAFAVWAGFYGWNGIHSRPVAPPHEQPMPLTVKAEEGKPTVNEMKPEAAPPVVAKAAPPAPTGSSALKKLAKCGMGMAAAAGVACAHAPIETGTQAGACPNAEAIERDFEGKRIPDVMHAQLHESNPGGKCQGKCDPPVWKLTCDEPCPVYHEGDITLKGVGESPEEWEWFGPNNSGDVWQGYPVGADLKRDIEKPPLFTGKTVTFKATGKYEGDFGHGPRDLSQRMTALITEMQTYEGKKVPVCGVLYGNDGKVGVPVFSSPYYQTPTGGSWGNAYIQFFWPDKKK